jgi:hypothetical protein
VQKDKDAVRAGLTWWINNGMVEEHVTKLKLIRKTGIWLGGLSAARAWRVLHAFSQMQEVRMPGSPLIIPVLATWDIRPQSSRFQ